MVFEAVVYCVDNSDFSINGDGSITRRQSQSDTINRLAASKIAESPETTVGLISMAGKRTTVMVPSTREPGEVLRTMHSLKNGGRCNILASLKTAQLVLKNRHNKNQKQRVILFIGSPIENDAASLLMKQAKIMKKNSVALDAVHFGIENVQSADNENLRKLVETANSGNNGRLVSVGEGESLADTAFGELAKVPQNGSAEMEDDPELALALKMSLEENQKATKTESEPMETEEDELAKAIAMSLSNQPDKSEKQQIDKLIGDKDFLSNLIESLPDVDKNDIDIDQVMKDALNDSTNNENEQNNDNKNNDDKNNGDKNNDDKNNVGDKDNNNKGNDKDN